MAFAQSPTPASLLSVCLSLSLTHPIGALASVVCSLGKKDTEEGNESGRHGETTSPQPAAGPAASAFLAPLLGSSEQPAIVLESACN